MTDAIRDFEADCASAGVAPSSVLREAGMNPSTWFRWKSGEVSPTLRSFDAAKEALKRLATPASPADPASMAPAAEPGADAKAGALQ